jgi:hypothetical protein
MGFACVWAFMLMKRVTFLRQEQEQSVTALQESGDSLAVDPVVIAKEISRLEPERCRFP